MISVYAGLGLAAATLVATAPLQVRQAANASTHGLQIFLDFDGTIATSDAYDTLAYAAYDSLNSNSTIPSWDEINNVYNQVYDAASANLTQPTSLASDIAYQNNAVLRAVEQWSFIYVQDTGLFDTVTTENLVKYASNVTLRDGWCSFASAARDRGIMIHVVSLNWSPSWIRLVLQEASDCPDILENVSTYCPEILPPGPLPANELDHNVPLFSGGDKTALIAQIMANLSNPDSQSVVFASDGEADLQPLWDLPTNVGAVAGFSNSAAEAFGSYNISIANATQGWQGFTGPAGSNNTIYGFEAFTDLETLLWG